jgi:hypothetical protein
MMKEGVDDWAKNGRKRKFFVAMVDRIGLSPAAGATQTQEKTRGVKKRHGIIG